MATTNYNLPTITGNMTADVVRDMNALAEATDDALKGIGDSKANKTDLANLQTQVTTHLDETAYLSARTNADQSIANNTLSIVAVNTLILSNGGGITLESDNGILISETGDYEVEAYVQWDANATGVRRLVVSNSLTTEASMGQNFAMPVTKASTATHQYVAVSLRLLAGTKLYMKVYQDSGAALSLVRNANAPFISVKRLKRG